MRPNILLMFLAPGLLVSCAAPPPVAEYAPVTKPETIEYRNAHMLVYPEDVRKDPARYANLVVAWAGIILTNDATEEDFNSKILMTTVFENRYFDWEQNYRHGNFLLLISPRGEGHFRMHWSVDRKDQDATSQDAMKFAAPGKLAIVYGSPESVDEDGTIVLRYRYARIISPKHFTANEVNYGRPGESYHPASYQPRFAASSPSP